MEKTIPENLKGIISMFAIDLRNEKLHALLIEMTFSRFAKQVVSQLLLTDGMELSQQVVDQITQLPVAQFTRLPLFQKAQTLSGGLENFIVMAKGQEAGYGF